MLTKQQKTWFIDAINTILSLDISEQYDLALDGIDTNTKRDSMSAFLKFGENGVRLDWYLLYTRNRVYLVTASGNPVPLIIPQADGSYDINKSSEAIISMMAEKSANTLLSVITTIIKKDNDMDEPGMEEYHKIYPRMSDFIDRDGEHFNIALKINGDDVIDLNDASQVRMMNVPLETIGHITVDILGKSKGTLTPLYRLQIQNKTLNLARYTVPQRSHVSELPQVKLSNQIDHIDLSDLDSTNIHRAICSLMDSYTVKDSVSDLSSIRGAKVVISWLDTLTSKQLPYIVYASQLGHANMNGNVAYAVDDLPDAYVAHDMKVNVDIQGSTKSRICIKYTSNKFGTIAEIHCNPDSKNIANPENLNDHKNIFTLAKDDNAIIVYNTGLGNTAQTETRVTAAFEIVRDLLVILNGVSDVSDIVTFTTVTLQGNAVTKFDEASAKVQYAVSINPMRGPVAKLRIKSLTNDKVLPMELLTKSLPGNGGLTLSCNLPISGELVETLYNTNIDNTYNNKMSLYDEAVNYVKNKSRTVSNIGEYIIMFVKTRFSKNVMTDNSGNVVNANDNQQTKVNNASKLQSKSMLGRMLLVVRNAFLDTFSAVVDGKTIPFIGTKRSPGYRSMYDIKEEYASTSKLVNPSNGDNPDAPKQLEPVLASFYIGNEGSGGAFTAMFSKSDGNTNKVPHVYCQFNQKWREVTLMADPESHRPVLDDAFLKWYLLDCHDINAVATAIDRLVANETVARQEDLAQQKIRAEESGVDANTVEQMQSTYNVRQFGISDRVASYFRTDDSEGNPEDINYTSWDRDDVDVVGAGNLLDETE